MEQIKKLPGSNMFAKKKLTFTLSILGVVALFWLATYVTDYDVLGGALAPPRAIYWMVNNLVPTADSWVRMPTILSRLLETALVSVAVTVCAAACALLFSLLGTKTMKVNGIISRLVRIIAAIFRAIPEVVWAILFMFSFGQNILTGFFALFFYTFGTMTRAFIETIDEVSGNCVEALQATGASSMQVVFQGIVPSAITVVISWILYMIETNIRAATLIGLLTGTGIGALFNLYYTRLDYGSAALVVYTTAVLVIGIELVSNQIRKVIL